MPTAISGSHIEVLHTDRTAAQKCDQKKNGPSAMTSVAILVSSFVLGLILFGPGGAIVFTTVALIGLGMVFAITDDDCNQSLNVHHTYHSSHYNPPPARFNFSWDATPITPRQTSSYIPTARAPAPRVTPAPFKSASPQSTGMHLPRGHVNPGPASRFERPEGQHLPRGHIRK